MVARLFDNIPDEVLYHARIHPEQRCNSLSEEQIRALHLQIRNVCTFAVEVNADDSKFPDDWLFKYRWVYVFSPLILGQGINLAMKG